MPDKKVLACGDCNAPISRGTVVAVHVSCQQFKEASPCAACGRLHWLEDGTPVSNRGGRPAFYKDQRMSVINAEGVKEIIDPAHFLVRGEEEGEEEGGE
ncbi:MAG: hypothetical protein WC385_00910 [Candidatus Paceibacterota bacterium]|jgi:hypothetical protein